MSKSLFQNGAVRSALPLLATLVIWAGGLTAPAQTQTTKLNVAYTSTTTNFSMEMITHVRAPKPHNIKHPSKPWYVVSLEVPERSRKYLGLLQRFTIAVESPAKLKEAHQALLAQREEFAIMEIGEIQDNSDGASFLIRDLNRNWWEIKRTRN